MTNHIQDPRLTDGRWLRIPGPTPVPPPVLAAMAEPMIPHRGKEMSALIRRLRERLQEVHRTEGDVMVWSGSGSAGWEAALQNSCRPGERVVATVTGDFGRRFADVAERLGLWVTRVEAPWGQAVSPQQVEDAIKRAGGVRAALITHNETSTGVTNPLRELAKVARRHGALVLVDAVSSAAAMPVEVGAWDLDWVISGSQKAWMCPPGLMIAALSERALQAAADQSNRRFFWDVEKMASAFQNGHATTTPAIPLYRALNVALDMMLDEGVEAMWERQAALGAWLRDRLKGLGLVLYADEAVASASVTAVRPPAGMPASTLRDMILADSGIEVAVGQGPETEAVIRVGHMGWSHRPEMEATVESIARVLSHR
ncbi:MAG TPA: alanine--glyoxylate aminotransferase family protein [Thermomicrobiales bacterium]|nr:alanine--glyoxylate aminotransferase family protein [Thermomicrobiales bacterium]